MESIKKETIPFLTITSNKDDEQDMPGPDSLLWPGFCAHAAINPKLQADPVFILRIFACRSQHFGCEAKVVPLHGYKL